MTTFWHVTGPYSYCHHGFTVEIANLNAMVEADTAMDAVNKAAVDAVEPAHLAGIQYDNVDELDAVEVTEETHPELFRARNERQMHAMHAPTLFETTVTS